MAALAVEKSKSFSYPLFSVTESLPECGIDKDSPKTLVFFPCNRAAEKIPLIQQICLAYEKHQRDVDWFTEERGFDLAKLRLAFPATRNISNFFKNVDQKCFLTLERLHPYNRSSLVRWLNRNATCPSCSTLLSSNHIVNAFALGRLIKRGSSLFSWKEHFIDIYRDYSTSIQALAAELRAIYDEKISLSSIEQAIRIVTPYVETLCIKPVLRLYPILLTLFFLRIVMQKETLAMQLLLKKWEKTAFVVSVYQSLVYHFNGLPHNDRRYATLLITVELFFFLLAEPLAFFKRSLTSLPLAGRMLDLILLVISGVRLLVWISLLIYDSRHDQLPSNLANQSNQRIEDEIAPLKLVFHHLFKYMSIASRLFLAPSLIGSALSPLFHKSRPWFRFLVQKNEVFLTNFSKQILFFQKASSFYDCYQYPHFYIIAMSIYDLTLPIFSSSSLFLSLLTCASLSNVVCSLLCNEEIIEHLKDVW